MPDLAEQIREALSMFAKSGTQPALIGGLAVVAHQVVRATQDVDFLVAAEAADKVHGALLNLGYQCLYRSEDAANYVRGTEGLDLLYAHRPTLDMIELREYFALFNQSELLDELLA